MQISTLLSLVAFSLTVKPGGAAFISSKNGQTELEIAEEVIQNVNGYMAQQGLSELTSGQEISYGPPIAKFSVSEVQFGNLSQIVLPQSEYSSVNRSEASGYSWFFYDLRLSLKDFHIYSRYSWRFLTMTGSGRIFLKLLNESVRLEGLVTLREDKTCHAELHSASFLDLGIFDIRMRSDAYSDILPIIVGNLVEISLNRGVLNPRIYINEKLSDAIQATEIKNNFEKIVCASFPIESLL